MSQSNVKLFSLVTWPTIKLARTKLSKLFHYSVPKMSWMRPGLRDLRRPLIQLWSPRNQLIWFLQPQQPQWQHLSRCVKDRVEVYHGLLVMILSTHFQKKIELVSNHQKYHQPRWPPHRVYFKETWSFSWVLTKNNVGGPRLIPIFQLLI